MESDYAADPVKYAIRTWVITQNKLILAEKR
jgi:hypothetical protein